MRPLRRPFRHPALIALALIAALFVGDFGTGPAAAEAGIFGKRRVKQKKTRQVEPAVGVVSEPQPIVPDAAVPGESLEPTGDELLEEPLPAEQPPSTREVLDQALGWASEAILFHEQGEDAKALESLHAARGILFEADLPEAMQEQGLSLLNCSLPLEQRQYDLEGLARLLEAVAGPDEVPQHAYIEREVRRILQRFGEKFPRQERLEVLIDEVERYIGFYQGKHREFFERAFERKHKYWPTIEAEFEARKIPVEMGYVALVESGFNPRAVSRANAHGLWQFIPGTGRRYQLQRRDDLFDVQHSTRAAAEYMLDLIGIFGSPSFLLATAAYNAGEGRILGCLRKLDDPFEQRSFWDIRPCLAPETQEYVPRVMAAAVIGSDPARFGFDVLTEDEARERYEVVVVPRPTSLSQLANRAGISVGELRTANSDLSARASSTPVRNFPLYVPREAGLRLAESLNGAGNEPALAAVETAPTDSEAAGGEPQRLYHRVRSGETLSEIAGRYGVAYSRIAEWNQLRAPYRLSIGQELVVYPGGDAPVRVLYTVQPGNTLVDIAEVFAVRYRDIMAWNRLRSSRLQVGQQLVIHPSRALRAVTHQVAEGESIGTIARRYGVAAHRILTTNGLSAQSVLHPGQRLVLYV